MGKVRLVVAILISVFVMVGVVAAGGRPLSATLTGASEFPGPGDPTATGTAEITVNPGQGELCYELTVEGLEPAAAAAHIHKGVAGQSGGIVVHLDAPSDGSSSGCKTISREFAMELIQNPENYYVNVHNAKFPGGAVRGQLSK